MTAEQTDMDQLADTITVSEAARLLACSRPYVYQLINEGRLTKIAPGKVLVSELESYLCEEGPQGRVRANSAETEQVASMAIALAELRKSLQFTQAQNAAMGRLLMESQAQTFSALHTENTRLAGQNQAYQEQHLSLLNSVGEILLRQEERRAIASGEEQKGILRLQAFELLAQAVPPLMEQIRSGGKVKTALTKLTTEERELLSLAAEGLGDRGAPLLELLKGEGPKK